MTKTKEQTHAETEAAAAAAKDTAGKDTGNTSGASTTTDAGKGDGTTTLHGGADTSATIGKDATASHVTGRSKDAPVIEERGTVTTGNVVERDAQIARANESMMKKSDDSSPGAQKLAKAAEDEEAAYANHADLPPTSGKAFNTTTPVLDDNGNKHWGVGN